MMFHSGATCESNKFWNHNFHLWFRFLSTLWLELIQTKNAVFVKNFSLNIKSKTSLFDVNWISILFWGIWGLKERNTKGSDQNQYDLWHDNGYG